MRKKVGLFMLGGSLLIVSLMTVKGFTFADDSSGTASSTFVGLQMPTGVQFQEQDLSGKGKVVVGSNGLVAFQYYVDGPRLIQLDGSTTAYWVSNNNFKLGMMSEKVFNSYNNKWEDVEKVSQAEFDHYPTSQFIRLMGSGPIYFLEGTTKRSIPGKIWNGSGLDAKQIIDVNKTEFDSYKTGKVIATAEEIGGESSEEPEDTTPVTTDDTGSGIDPTTIKWEN